MRIYGVTADGFSVEFDPAVAIVGNYTIRYSTGGAVNSISWPDASVRITGVNPIQNDYLVSISDDGGVTFTRDFFTSEFKFEICLITYIMYIFEMWRAFA